MLAHLREELEEESDKERWLIELMDEYGDRLTKLAHGYVKDWGKAQEVVQDVFLPCYKNYDKTSTSDTYKAWIYRVTINRSKDVLRSSWFKKVFVTNRFFQDAHSKEASPEGVSIRNQDYALLFDGIFSLPIKYREVILLFYYEELSIQEISELIRTNENTIKTRLKRGRELLNSTLKGSDLDER